MKPTTILLLTLSTALAAPTHQNANLNHTLVLHEATNGTVFAERVGLFNTTLLAAQNASESNTLLAAQNASESNMQEDHRMPKHADRLMLGMKHDKAARPEGGMLERVMNSTEGLFGGLMGRMANVTL